MVGSLGHGLPSSELAIVLSGRSRGCLNRETESNATPQGRPFGLVLSTSLFENIKTNQGVCIVFWCLWFVDSRLF